MLQLHLVTAVLLVLLLQTSEVVAAGKLLPSAGSYSFFSPRMKRMDFSGIEAFLGGDYGALRHTGRSEAAILEDLNDEEVIALAMLLERLFASGSSDSMYEKRRRVLNMNGKTIVSVPAQSILFYGWYNYAFEVTVTPMLDYASDDFRSHAQHSNAKKRKKAAKAEDSKKTEVKKKANSLSSPSEAINAAAEAGEVLVCQVEFLSARPQKSWFGGGDGGSKSRKLRVRFDIMVDIDGNVQLLHHYASTGISNREAQLVVGTLQHYLLSRLRQDLSVLKARRKQLESYDVELKIADKKKRDKRLDRILNPEKYRGTSPTVRRPGSGQGTGRYTPSAATQARRQVRRS